MDDEFEIKLNANPTETGFEILPINAGEAKGHGISFSAAVLKASLKLWDNLPCFLDHDYSGAQSVKNLAGALHQPAWNEKEQGIQAQLVPAGPGATALQALRLATRSDPALMAAVGFSAHLYIVQKEGQVQQITKVNSVDCVIDPARGGKFLATVVGANGVRPFNQGDQTMEDEKEVTAVGSEDTEATQELLQAQKKVEQTKKTGDESLRQLRLQTCRTLLKVSLEASKLPQPIQDRIDHRFSRQVEQGLPFEPAELESAISEEQEMVSQLTAGGVIQGPGRITSMVTSTDAIEAAASDLFGVKRDERLAKVKPARLTGIRELYLMLTGDYYLHGGY